MNNIILLSVGLILAIIFIQDLKSRLISVYTVVLLAILSFVFWYITSKEISYILYSFGFILLNFISLKIYTIVMKKEKTEDLIYGLGLGDILFFIAIIPLFSTTNYILFFISGLVISIITHGIVSLLTNNELIPLAGYLSFYLILFLSILTITNKSNYIDLIHI